jgi:hypothetical protein
MRSGTPLSGPPVMTNNPLDRTGRTEANALLERLLALSDGDLRNVLGAALEYADHPSIVGVSGLPAGKRLIMQVELGFSEVSPRT